MGGFVAYEKGPIDRLYDELPTRIPGVSVTVLWGMIWCANFEPGIFKGFRMDRGDVCMSEKCIQHRTGHSRKSVRNALLALIEHKEIFVKGAIEGARFAKVYHIVNYDIFIHNFKEGATQGAIKGPSRGHQGATSKELKEVKEIDQNLSPDGDGSAPASPSPPDLFPGGSRKAKMVNLKADPLTDPTTFLHRVEAEYPDTVLVWARDVGAMKTLLSARLRAGVGDPQGEAWEMWVEFLDGRIDDTLRDFRTKEMRRAHDVPTYVGNYALLRERIGADNGKGPKTGIGPRGNDHVTSHAEWAEKREQRRVSSSYRELWDKVCGRLEGMMPSISFEMWFRQAFIGRVEECVVVMDVPTQVHAEQIEDHYSEMVIAAIREEGVDVKGFGAEVFNQEVENGKPTPKDVGAVPLRLQ